MIMLCEKYDIKIPILENQVIVLSVENANAYSDIMNNLWNQVNGEDGIFTLIEKEKECNISKEIVFIWNPFELTCNDRKIIAKLYQELNQIGEEQYYAEVSNINQSIIKLLDDMSPHLPYDITYNLDFSLAELFKLYNVRIEEEDESLLNRIVNYMKLHHQIFRESIFVFPNLKFYINEVDLYELYKFCFYEKISLIIIEGINMPLYNYEKCWIIDKDLCTIEISEDNNV